MARPALETVSMLDETWFQKVNNNFEKLFDKPLPITILSQTVGVFDQDPRVFSECLGVFEGFIYSSNGTLWSLKGFEVLDIIANLNPSTATLNDIKSAYNTLLTDLKAKNWMAS